MSERELIREFREHFDASTVDEKHRHQNELLMGPFEPLVVHINNIAVGCVDLRKLPGTVDGYVELAYIYIYNDKRGQGSAILRKICELADLYNLEVELDAVPIKKFREPIPRTKLRAFYWKFGFKSSDVRGSNMMTRTPNS